MEYATSGHRHDQRDVSLSFPMLFFRTVLENSNCHGAYTHSHGAVPFHYILYGISTTYLWHGAGNFWDFFDGLPFH